MKSAPPGAVARAAAEGSELRISSAVRASIALLEPGDRRMYGAVVISQMLTALLDLAGVILLGGVALLASSAVQGTALPLTAQAILDRLGLADSPTEDLAGIVAVVAAILLLLKTATYAILTRFAYRFLGRRQAEVSGRLATELLELPLSTIERRPSQETAFALTQGVYYAITLLLGSMSMALAEVAMLGLLGVALFFFDPAVTIFAVAYFGVVALGLQRGFGNWSARIGSALAETSVQSYQSLQESLVAYREISVAGRRALYADRIRQLLRRSASASADGAFIVQVPKFTYEGALVFGAILLAGWQFLTRDTVAALTTLALFLAAGTRVVPSMLRLSATFITARATLAAARLGYEIAAEIACQPRPLDDQGERVQWPGRTERNEEFIPSLSVQDVGAEYEGSSVDVLRGISFTAAPGQSVALVGATGSGKSTLADVILGILTPKAGRVLIGGLPPARAIERWPGQIAYVPQAVAMSNGTIRENVALGLPLGTYTDEEIWRSLRRAHLDTFLSGQREGLDTLVGERGVKLSGGQRQRLGLARALVTQPKFLVLDEATSALDAETEAAIASMLRELSGSVTTVTIAHRLASVVAADCVVYLDGGIVVARGSFDEVRSAIPAFDRQANLLGLQ